MATNLDGDETCRHGFTGLPEDCVRCAREAHQAAIEAARQEGYREGWEACREAAKLAAMTVLPPASLAAKK